MKRPVPPWTDAEIQYLRVNATRLSRDQLAAALGRSPSSVKRKTWALELDNARGQRVWSEEHRTYAVEHFDASRRTQSVEEIAVVVKRTPAAVMAFLRTQGLWKKERSNYKTWSPAELKLLMFKCEKHSTAELAKMLGRTVCGVRNKMQELGYQPLCGMYTLQAASRETGYDGTQLKRAKKGLKQEWRRVSGRWVLSPHQVRDLCEWLKNEGKPQESEMAIAA